MFKLLQRLNTEIISLECKIAGILYSSVALHYRNAV